MFDGAGLAVHQLPGSNDLATECFADRLVPEADAQNRNLAGEVPDQFNADAGF